MRSPNYEFMSERQKQNKNLVQGPHQTDPPYIKKTNDPPKLNRMAEQNKIQSQPTIIVMHQPGFRVAVSQTHVRDQKTVVALAAAGYTPRILHVV
jgi:hypothetical protein